MAVICPICKQDLERPFTVLGVTDDVGMEMHLDTAHRADFLQELHMWMKRFLQGGQEPIAQNIESDLLMEEMEVLWPELKDRR